eukprot:861975-Ditylum_brightwellii.AAC.1
MVPATPANVGATYLQKSYDVLHEDDGFSMISTDMSYFYCPAFLSEAAYEEIAWWEEYLSFTPCAISHPLDPMVLATTWGDGSGT